MIVIINKNTLHIWGGNKTNCGLGKLKGMTKPIEFMQNQLILDILYHHKGYLICKKCFKKGG